MNQVHSFHIPVLGTGFTIDSPLKVARFGINSVVSLVDDMLIEQMRRFHSLKNGLPYEKIGDGPSEKRAERITAYLNLMDDLIIEDMDNLKEQSFTPESELTQYFEMLPQGTLKTSYINMLTMEDGSEKNKAQAALKEQLQRGAIDVNIMTKLDAIPAAYADEGADMGNARTALKGFALSKTKGSIIFSAGMNPGLFDTIKNFTDFIPDKLGNMKKRIVIKVSDFRSAILQGKILARKGLWVSEYRIESGLNCGGHTFATKGLLAGPILKEFREGRDKLFQTMKDSYSKVSKNPVPSEMKVTYQGGIGTAEEDQFIRSHYELDGTGWGSPFMLTPEAINIMEDDIDLLKKAGDDDIYLSHSSPLNVRFWNVKGSASETEKQNRIDKNQPGAPCRKGYLAISTEVSEKPLCIASRQFIKKRLELLETEDHSPEKKAVMKERILAKACLCHDLAGSATKLNHIDDKALPALTPGPNLAWFTKKTGLKEMIDHIYGYTDLLKGVKRPHLFMSELKLYIHHLGENIDDVSTGILKEGNKYFQEFQKNLQNGLEYYSELAEKLTDREQNLFKSTLESLTKEFNIQKERINNLKF